MKKDYELVVSLDRDTIVRKGMSVVDLVRAMRSFTLDAIEQSEFNADGERTLYVVKKFRVIVTSPGTI